MISARDPRWKTAAAKPVGQAYEHACTDARSAIKMCESLESMLKSGHLEQAAERCTYLAEKFFPIMLKAIEQAKADHEQAKAKAEK